MCASPWFSIACQYQDRWLHCTVISLSSFSHNAELFSKNAFSAGLYRNKDMVDLDMTNERDYATYMALVSSGQGKNSEKMLENLKNKLGNKTWIEYCHDINSWCKLLIITKCPCKIHSYYIMHYVSLNGWPAQYTTASIRPFQGPLIQILDINNKLLSYRVYKTTAALRQTILNGHVLISFSLEIVDCYFVIVVSVNPDENPPGIIFI